VLYKERRVLNPREALGEAPPPRDSPEPSAAERARPVEIAVLVAILAGGAALRAWGIGYGLPHLQARPDEEVIVPRLLGFDTGDWNPHWFIYPTFHLYLLYAWLKLLLWGGAVAGGHAAPSLAELSQHDPVRFYLLARWLSVLCGTLTLWVVYRLGRALGGVRAGLVAALALAVSLLHVRESHFFKPDATLALFTTATLLACVHLQRRGTLRAATLAGVACGLTLGIKYNAALLLPVAVAALLGGTPGRWRRVLVAGAVALGTMILTSPYIVLDHRTFLASLNYVRVVLEHGGPGIVASLAQHARNSFLLAQGLPLSLFAVGALAWNVRSVPMLPINAFLLASVVQLGTSALAYSRYFTPLVPPLCAIVGVTVAQLAARAPARWRAALTALLLVALLGGPLRTAIRFDRIIAEPDTRVLARAWLDAHVPAGSTVLVLGAPWPYTFGDPDLTGYRIRRNPTLDPALGIAYVLTHEHPIPFSRVPPQFEALRPRLRLEATFSPFTGPEPPAGAVFELQDGFYVPLAGFDGVVRGGPAIHIYAVTPGAPS
jgi:hypothetical protein